jgi:hypothetical protein
VVTVSTDLTERELKLLSDPKVAEGALLEAEYQRRCWGRHAELVDVVITMAETRQDWSSQEIVESVARIYAPRRPWWRRWWSP